MGNTRTQKKKKKKKYLVTCFSICRIVDSTSHDPNTGRIAPFGLLTTGSNQVHVLLLSRGEPGFNIGVGDCRNSHWSLQELPTQTHREDSCLLGGFSK